MSTAKTLYHVTTPKKLARYVASGRIIAPVRGFTTVAAAQEWARRTGRSIILEVCGTDCNKLPDHHNQFGCAWWIDHDVTEWNMIDEEDIISLTLREMQETSDDVSELALPIGFGRELSRIREDLCVSPFVTITDDIKKWVILAYIRSKPESEAT